jgi:chitin-binding protein
VKTPETVTLTASSGGVSVTYPLQLNSSSASSPPSSTQHVVNLTWNPPASSNPVAGYRVFRSAEGISNFQLLNSSINTQTDYSDSTVASGETYDYEVKSVSSTGQESAPSNITTVTIP